MAKPNPAKNYNNHGGYSSAQYQQNQSANNGYEIHSTPDVGNRLGVIFRKYTQEMFRSCYKYEILYLHSPTPHAPLHESLSTGAEAKLLTQLSSAADTADTRDPLTEGQTSASVAPSVSSVSSVPREVKLDILIPRVLTIRDLIEYTLQQLNHLNSLSVDEGLENQKNHDVDVRKYQCIQTRGGKFIQIYEYDDPLPASLALNFNSHSPIPSPSMDYNYKDNKFISGAGTG